MVRPRHLTRNLRTVTAHTTTASPWTSEIPTTSREYILSLVSQVRPPPLDEELAAALVQRKRTRFERL